MIWIIEPDLEDMEGTATFPRLSWEIGLRTGFSSRSTVAGVLRDAGASSPSRKVQFVAAIPPQPLPVAVFGRGWFLLRA